eukprot:912557-Amorphochlora_amoeboformis.AAC.1
MNQDADACSDFYEYSCGRFQHDVSAGGIYTYTFDGLEDIENQKLVEIFTKPGALDDFVIGRFFQDCMTTPAASVPVEQSFSNLTTLVNRVR